MKRIRCTLFLSLLLLWANTQAQPLYKGLGIILRVGESWHSFPVVERVIPGSDAEKQGILPGMNVWKVDAVETLGLKLEDVVEALDTPVGSVLSVDVGAGEERRILRLTAMATRGRCLEGDCVDGEGVLAGVDRGVYRGRFVKGLLEGFGRVDFADDDWYEGDFTAGEFSGKGRRVQGKWCFTGRWEHGVRAAGPGVLTSSDGGTLSGDGAWDRGFTGKGTYELPEENLCFEANFENGWNLLDVSGRVSVRNLSTNHCFEGNFRRSDPEGEGVFIAADGSRTPFAPAGYRGLLRALANPAGIATAAPKTKSERDWGVDAPVEEATVQKLPARPVTTVSRTLIDCEPCGGSGFEVNRCTWCSGRGYTEQVLTRYHTREGNSYQKSTYDNTGRYLGQSTVRDVTNETERSALKQKCYSCDGRGFRVTSRRCVTCGGKGKVILISEEHR